MREGVQGLLVVRHGLLVGRRAKACCPACRKYGTACGSQPAPHEMHRQGCRHLPCTLPKALRQPGPNAGMPAGLTPGRDPLIQDFLIQGVEKAIAGCHRAIGPFRSATGLQKLALMGQRRAPRLNDLLGALEGCRHRRG